MSKFFGAVFPEQIIKEKFRKKIPIEFDKEEDTGEGRFAFFVVIFLVGFTILVARLFFLSIVEGARYRKLSAENRIREVKIEAPRGIIYDREGIALVRNIPVFKDNKSGVVHFGEKPQDLSANFSESIAREYTYGKTFAHVVGYTGEATNKDLKTNYQIGDIVGKMGIESPYDKLLRGVEGRQLNEVDAMEKKLRVLGKIDPVSGQNITLTVSSGLQEKAGELLAGKRGAIVASIPESGEVLTLYSSPSFDPNRFVRSTGVEEILSSDDRPLFNRAIAGQYPPGSTFKIVTAIAALENGSITKDSKIEDTGVLQVGRFSYGNWYFTQHGRKEGFLDIVGAIKRSNDIFFYKAGEAVGINNLSAWAKKLGTGQVTGIDIEGEEAGVMPDPVWQRKVKNEDWFLGNTYHAAIGQGDILATPLQVNQWTNIVANGGRLCQPHLLITLGNLSNLCKDLEIRDETIELVREGMKQACSPGGTGWPLFNFRVSLNSTPGVERGVVETPVACKTGTAEFGHPKGKTHAWFTAFAPVVNPQISVTVLVEEGGEGSSVAAPIAKAILEEWFSEQ